MRTTRVYVPELLDAGALVTLPRQTSEHITRVLRLGIGATLVAFDGHGAEYDAELASLAKSGAQIRIGASRGTQASQPLAITLLQSLARGEKMDWIVQKATELGVHRIVPVAVERSVVRLDAEQAHKRVEHWRGVAIGACEQCGRNRLPTIEAPLSLAQALADTALLEQRVVFDTAASPSLSSTLTPAIRSIGLLVGPEGGFTEVELQAAARAGFQAVSFGPRVLRTETCAIAALAVIQNRIGDL
jgi:16S rRNA (uracil1498-N3)-methyltransferase